MNQSVDENFNTPLLMSSKPWDGGPENHSPFTCDATPSFSPPTYTSTQARRCNSSATPCRRSVNVSLLPSPRVRAQLHASTGSFFSGSQLALWLGSAAGRKAPRAFAHTHYHFSLISRYHSSRVCLYIHNSFSPHPLHQSHRYSRIAHRHNRCQDQPSGVVPCLGRGSGSETIRAQCVEEP
jgi:hypothetical protein